MKKRYRILIYLISAIMLVGKFAPDSAAVTKEPISDHLTSDQQSFIEQIDQALQAGNRSVAFLSAPLSDRQSAEKLKTITQQHLDEPYWFMENGYISYYTISENSGSYYLKASVQPYRNRSINDIDWEGIAADLSLDGLDDMQKAITVHEWICDTLTYDLNAPDSLEDCLQEGIGKCDDYATIFGKVLQAAGVETRCMSGIENGTKNGHMWNLIQIDGYWYYCDLVFDDNNDGYEYFMKGSSDIDFLTTHQKYMTKESVTCGIDAFSSYDISGANYFQNVAYTESSRFRLSDVLGIKKSTGRNAETEFVNLYDGTSHAGKSDSDIIVMHADSGVCFGSYTTAKKKPVNFLVYKYM